ncbi:MAG: four helix bundle protein [candidate division WOR-3 bacterium]
MATGLENLEIYQLAEELEIKVYEITKKFPAEEKYRSVDQLRRSSSSVSDNITKDYSRFSFNDKINKFYIAQAEAEETKRGLGRACKKGFISKEVTDELIERYTILIKKIDGHIKFLNHSKTSLQQSNQFQSQGTKASKQRSNQSVSLLLVLLIISTLLMAGLTVGDLVLRHAQATKAIEFSDMAYFAAESGIEKVVYKVFKEYCNISTSACAVNGTLLNGAQYIINQSDIVVDSVSSPWLATVSAGRSLQISLDINGATYPTSITISQNGSSPTDLIFWQCQTETAGSRICKTSNPAPSQIFYSSLPQTLSLSPSDHYYKIRINNRGSQSETYSFTFSGSLPIGLKINEAIGKYKGYVRKIRSIFPHYSKWQIIAP